MSAEQRRQDRLVALDPARSVVVEACAGSGKTWLLSSRLLRLLLAGARPGDILAITFTRKAAREIESRLTDLLRDLATAPEAKVRALLSERGVAEQEMASVLPRARALFETVLHAQPAMTITTFHGWFARLLSAAPLGCEVAGRALSEASASLFDDAWQLLARQCARDTQGALAQSLLWLYEHQGASASRKMLKAFIDRRAEWQVWQAGFADDDALQGWIVDTFGLAAEPLMEVFSPKNLDELRLFAALLGRNTPTDQDLANQLAQVVLDVGQAHEPDLGAAFALVQSIFLTKNETPRVRKTSDTQRRRLSPEGEDSLLHLHAQWSERALDTMGRLRDQASGRLNQHTLRVAQALLSQLRELKSQRHVMDFSDLEAEVDRLLSQEGSAAFLQARLDARYKHVLLDEFQDTNPLQWRILRAWLDAYAECGVARPSVFLVGDPKQSIYRFRRAEPKLFAAAMAYFQTHFGAELIRNDHTFRNAGAMVAFVNTVFADEPVFTGFQPQSAEFAAWPARIEILPLIAAEPDESAPRSAEGFRLPLIAAREEPEDVRRREEAALLAERIAEMVGQWRVMNRDGSQRVARYADVMILTRRKTHLGVYEAALRAAGIPYVSPGQGGLLDTLEAQDLLACLRFLADPADNLALAHTLRTPALDCSDEDLLAVSEAGGVWWYALCQLASQPHCTPALQRSHQLLLLWLDAAAELPAHDLIDRILHQSDWYARTRAAVPEAMWPAIHANLDAMVALSLDVDAGRYPSLTRFVDELKRLSVAADEAPDEGLIAAEGEGMGRVRIMTIHGAKGLEAPIVWLIDANAPPKPDEGSGVMMAWPAEETAPQHFSFVGRIKDMGSVHCRLREASEQAAEREELNLLYVAITRAAQVFVISGIEAANNRQALTPYARIALKIGLQQGSSGIMGKDLSGERVLDVPACRPAMVAVLQPLPSIGLRRQKPLEQTESAAARAFGTALHAWLEARCAGRPLPNVAPEVARSARALYERPSLARFFDPQHYRRAGNETAYLDARGDLRRIDRWVECEDAIWVLDYKSGRGDDPALMAEYRQQIGSYREVLQGIFPGRTVKALLVFSEGGEVEIA